MASATYLGELHGSKARGSCTAGWRLAANPPVSVLVYRCDARDVLVVVLNPRGGDKIPATADEIAERVTQISFSSALSSELHAIALARAEAQQSSFAWGRLDRRLSRLNLHVIDSGSYLSALDPTSLRRRRRLSRARV